MDHGIDETDPFGVGALFVSQAMAHRFDCESDVESLLEDLLALDTPKLPDVAATDVVGPIDRLLDRIEEAPVLLELVHALLKLGAETPPRSEVSQQLYRAVMWTMMRHDPERLTPEVLEILRLATPGARFQATDWPRHEFFSTVLVLIYLGGTEARSEMNELLEAAKDLDYHDLAPVLEWYLDHRHAVPSR